MAKLSKKRRAALDEAERLAATNDRLLSPQDFEAPLKAAGCTYKDAELTIRDYGSSHLFAKYIKSFGGQPLSAELQRNRSANCIP